VIRATLRTITGRRGSFRVGALVVLASVVVVIGVLVVVHELRPGRNPSIGGQPMLDGVGGAVWALGTVVAILLGALAGSYDVAQGTIRYLVLTGVGRFRLYAARTVAVVVAVLLLLVPALALGLAAVVFPLVFALIAMGIGTVLRSNGPAIAISLLFLFAGAPLLALIEAANETAGDLMLIQALDRITGGETSIPVAAAALAVVGWIGLFWAAGLARLLRDEY
jgi:hypothetical protein